MSQPNYRYWDPRIDEDLYSIRIDTDLPIRVDHYPITDVAASSPSQSSITGSNSTAAGITSARSIGSQITGTNTVGSQITGSPTSHSEVTT